MVLEAVWRKKVRAIYLSKLREEHDEIYSYNFVCPDEEAAFYAAVEQIGKLYDIKALFGLWLHRDWQDVRKWFCSELVAYVLAKGGCKLFRADVMRRITPGHLWMVAK